MASPWMIFLFFLSFFLRFIFLRAQSVNEGYCRGNLLDMSDHESVHWRYFSVAFSFREIETKNMDQGARY